MASTRTNATAAPKAPHPTYGNAAATAALLGEVLALTPELYGRTVVGHLAAALDTLAELGSTDGTSEALTADDVLRAIWRAANAAHKLSADLAARRASTAAQPRR